jgi:hypothetical protein
MRRMEVVSLCALRASGFEWQPGAGTYALTAICKATFELHPNECALAPEQEDPSDTDTFWNDDPRRSVVVPSDRAPYKPRADVVLVGHAYAPNREPARAIMTRLLVGEIDKSIEVWCDRGFRTHAGQLLEGQRQSKMLLTWERAAGGPETNNPVGMRFDATPDRFGVVAIPNLQPPGAHFGQWGDTFAPVGYGPVAPHWPARTQKLYRSAGSFAAQGWEQRPLPDSFDYGYFNVAPPDQQVTELRPNERIVLENLHPQHERIVTNLPGVRPRAVADRATGEREEIALKADTLWFDTDRGICTVVWRGLVHLRHPREAGRVAFWVDGIPRSSVMSFAPMRRPATLILEDTWNDKPAVGGTTLAIAETAADPRSALPFIKGALAPPPLAGVSAAAPPPSLGPLTDATEWDDGTGTLAGPMTEQVKDALPFAHGLGTPPNLAGEPVAWAMPGPADHNEEQAMGPVFASAAQGVGTPTPFRPPSPPLPQPPQPQVFIAAGAPIAFPVHEEPKTPRAEKPAAIDPIKEAPLGEVARPPMMGPLAVAPRTVESEAKPPGVGAEGAPPATLAQEEPPAPAENKPKPEDFPIERCGALTARIALRKPDKARILEEEGLSPGHWAAVEQHWAAVIRDETKRGKKARLDQFDAAYVEQLEKERGPIKALDYARLMVAAEREATDDVLEEMGLPRGAVMRIERVWLQRLVKDPGLMERVGEAMEAERNSGSA